MNPIKTHSHHMLGKYLAEEYLLHAPKRYIVAFLIGCTQPDKNPATYLKGSLRCRPLRGHNWESAQNYMQRIAVRLERRHRLKLLDYYTMGKLIHYTVDAFTSSHNESFTDNLNAHRFYEKNLQVHFLSYLHKRKRLRQGIGGSVMDAIRSYHTEYSAAPSGIRSDCRYSVLVSSLVVCMLLAKSTLPFPVPGL